MATARHCKLTKHETASYWRVTGRGINCQRQTGRGQPSALAASFFIPLLLLQPFAAFLSCVLNLPPHYRPLQRMRPSLPSFSARCLAGDTRNARKAEKQRSEMFKILMAGQDFLSPQPPSLQSATRTRPGARNQGHPELHQTISGAMPLFRI